MTVPWRIGVEVELLAPPGLSRRDLAQTIAKIQGGSVEPFFHQQSEPSKVPGLPVFHNLTHGFRVSDSNGEWVVSCVDDLTLQTGLVRSKPAESGWFRIVSDDERLLRLLIEQTAPSEPLTTVMQPLAQLFGTEPEAGPQGMIRVRDKMGASVAMAAPLPGERERPCEIVTAPMEGVQQRQQLEMLLRAARELDFTIPQEGATHIHFDASRLRSARALARLVELLSEWREALKRLLKVNPNCRRLGDWPQELRQVTSRPDYAELDWPRACQALSKLGLTKFCDFNILNLVSNHPYKQTVEFRVMPSYLEATPILEAAQLLAGLLNLVISEQALPPKGHSDEQLAELLKAQVTS